MSRDNMDMDMRHRLARHRAVLDGNVEALAVVGFYECFLDDLDGGEEVADFVGREIGGFGDDAEGTDEDVAGEERLEVDEAEGEGGAVEDLAGFDGEGAEEEFCCGGAGHGRIGTWRSVGYKMDKMQ